MKSFFKKHLLKFLLALSVIATVIGTYQVSTCGFDHTSFLLGLNVAFALFSFLGLWGKHILEQEEKNKE